MTDRPTVPLAPATPAPPGRRGRGVRGTVADMARSLGVLIACVAVVWFVSGMWHRSSPTRLGVANWQAEVADVAPGAPFALEAPATLPAGWSVSALGLSGAGSQAAWTMTVTTPTGHYLDLDQAVGGLSSQAGSVLADGVAGPTVQLAQPWVRYRLPADDQGVARAGLGREVGTTAVIVSGTGSGTELDRFANFLHEVH